MISRYTRPAMGALWNDEAQFQSWLDVELAACAAWSEATGRIPPEDVETLQAAQAASSTSSHDWNCASSFQRAPIAGRV